MNNQDAASFPQVEERIKSLFENAERYRQARERRNQESAQAESCEQQLELHLEKNK